MTKEEDIAEILAKAIVRNLTPGELANLLESSEDWTHDRYPVRDAILRLIEKH
jgi:DNA-binding GntR family transcriptional regulator